MTETELKSLNLFLCSGVKPSSGRYGPRLLHSGRARALLNGGSGFLSGQGYFLLLSISYYLPTFLHRWSALNQVPQGGASLTGCCEGKIFFTNLRSAFVANLQVD